MEPIYNPDDWALVGYQPTAPVLEIDPFVYENNVVEEAPLMIKLESG